MQTFIHSQFGAFTIAFPLDKEQPEIAFCEDVVFWTIVGKI